MLTPNWVHPQPRDEVLNRIGEDPSALERGLTVLEMDVPLLEGVTLDLLAVDAEGRPVGVLAGDLDEDALLVRGLDVMRAWNLVGHLMRRIYHGEGFRFEEPLRLILLAQCFTERLRDILAMLGGLRVDLREYRVVVAEGRRLPVLAERSNVGAAGPSAGASARPPVGQPGEVPAGFVPPEFEPPAHPGHRPEGAVAPAMPITVPVAPVVGLSPEEPHHRLFQDVRRKILRIGEEIDEEETAEGAVFSVSGSLLAELSLGPRGLTGRLGGVAEPTDPDGRREKDPDEPDEEVSMNDRRALDGFLNRVFRLYFDLSAAPLPAAVVKPAGRRRASRPSRRPIRRAD